MTVNPFRKPWIWLFCAVAATLPFWLPSYFLHVATVTMIMVALASAWNIPAGIGGLLSMGQSIFVTCGGILASALLVKLGINLWLGAIATAVLAAVIGATMAWFDNRFRLGHLSFALITLAFAEINQLVTFGTDFVGGASGVYLPKDTGDFLQFQFGGSTTYYLVSLALAMLLVALNVAILRSRLGYYLRAIRDNDRAAQAAGVPVLQNNMFAMALSGATTSLIGTFYARYLTFADPNLLASTSLTIYIILAATVGGLGTALGPLVGAVLLVPVGELLSAELGAVLPGLQRFIYGAVVVVVVLCAPSGIVATLSSWMRRRNVAPDPGPTHEDDASAGSGSERQRASV